LSRSELTAGGKFLATYLVLFSVQFLCFTACLAGRVSGESCLELEGASMGKPPDRQGQAARVAQSNIRSYLRC
jgi:hypothetical protein